MPANFHSSIRPSTWLLRSPVKGLLPVCAERGLETGICADNMVGNTAAATINLDTVRRAMARDRGVAMYVPQRIAESITDENYNCNV
ncbi:hypothetical protein VCV18_000420 [Metarhizium anisopliae]